MKNPLDPTLMKAWNKGREAGRKEAVEEFHLYFGQKMSTLMEIDGIGAKTAQKVIRHVLDRE